MARATEFRATLKAAKARINPTRFRWYPYETLSNVDPLCHLSTKAGLSISHVIQGGPVLDVGCADGDLSFLLESLGCKVDAVDYAPINYNGMLGINELKSALGSSVEVHEVNLEAPSALPKGPYEAVFFLGVLYHLKNPFHVLEELANRAKCCFLSTRIAQFTPDGLTRLQHVPVAYLLDEGEANNDATNYWIFSEAGLTRILQRTGWSVCSFLKTGATEASDPAHPGRDERAFCFLQSLRFTIGSGYIVDVGNPAYDDLLGPEWYDNEGGFRWMPQRATLRIPGPLRLGQKLCIEGYCPARLLKDGPVRLTVNVSGHNLPDLVLDKAERPFRFELGLPNDIVGKPFVEVAVTADRTFTPPGEERELGVAFGRFEVC